MNENEKTARIILEVAAEVARSTAKHGDQNHLPLGTGPHVEALSFAGDGQTAENLAQQAKYWTDERSKAHGDGTVTWRDILTEEVFEAYAEDDPIAVRAELVQVASVAVKMIAAIDASPAGLKEQLRKVFTAGPNEMFGPVR
ncbi:hypothetical protein ACIGCK_04905 [Microbacterium sp. NPDC078428]|uniref:hypothetical protein n=1 Tax=Microbacterium sp. NPDC078428 TaxID=3364190 RepID=UPI0037CBBCD6